MKYIPFLLFFLACTPQTMKAVEDIVEGEVHVVEQAVQDLTNVQPSRPAVQVPVKKF